MSQSPVLILSPHCDDAPLSLGGSLLARSWGENVHVVVIFSRSRYTRFATWDNDVDAVSALRQAEERRAAERAGCTVEFLPFSEPGVRAGFPDIGHVFDPQRPVEGEAVWEDVRAALLARLNDWTGTVIAPLGLGNHIDHRITHAALLEIAEANPQLTPVFYEDLPYAAEHSSLHIRGRVPTAIRSRPLIPALIPAGSLAAKLNLLSVYESQLTEGQLHNVAAHWDCRGGGELVWTV